MKTTRGKKVDVAGISETELKKWLKAHPDYKNFVKCQVLLSLLNGAQMNTVCEVFATTREAVRRWKDLFRTAGINGLTGSNRKGKTPYIDKAKRVVLVRVLSDSPEKQGYRGRKWTGELLKNYVQKKWNITISTRTAQVWMRTLK